MQIFLDKAKIYRRFCSYTAVDTTSDPKSSSFPSAARELDLAKLLASELKKIGLCDVKITEYGYVLASLAANTLTPEPVIGLIAHLDTSSEAKGAGVRAQLHENYQGGVLTLGAGAALDPANFPELDNYHGQDLITADGTTLLGADDKAGITAIVSACEYPLAHPELKHGLIRLAFTPDEEIGRGTEHFPLEEYAADFAYTVDGGALGELNYETFNAANASVIFQGISVHPGDAKQKMRNAVTLAAEWQLALPAAERPEYTEGYEGFYHTLSIEGGTDRVELAMILRDHDAAILERRKEYLRSLAAFFNAKYGSGSVKLEITDSYPNMKQYILPVFHVVERALRAMRAAGVKPRLVPVRGGTDGSRLSAMGLPCPNIFTGGHNFHGRFEYLPLEALLKCTETLIRLVMAEGNLPEKEE